ncbi:hypothetical protein AXF42_Ash009597 [Apostasia shenzhenica]|uniref:Uncharacterized protein n=1 Tax=Apostasia shenzhenica TaxID=1088818 RepID=A0A2I0B994_9ASPA|nr:hypothetical protein AXF42_Ash009597 [Apostasia shenzhenica]
MDISTSQISHTECDYNNREVGKKLSKFTENENNPDWSKFKDKSFPLFNIIDLILDAIHAKGDLFRSSRVVPRTSVSPRNLQVEEIGEEDDVEEDSTLHEAFNLTDLEPFPTDGLGATLTQGTFTEPTQNDSGSQTIHMPPAASK